MVKQCTELATLLTADGLKSFLTSLRTTKSGREKTALAAQIGSKMPPSALYNLFTPDLQGVLDGRCKTMSTLTSRKDVPTLQDISDAYDNDDVAVEWIKIQLERVNSFTNVKEKLSIEQLYDLGVQIFNCYGNLNTLEFSLFCGRLRRGKYERFFGSVDPMKILLSLEIFIQERSNDWYNSVEENRKAKKIEENSQSKPMSPKELVAKYPGKYPTIERLLRTSRL